LPIASAVVARVRGAAEPNVSGRHLRDNSLAAPLFADYQDASGILKGGLTGAVAAAQFVRIWSKSASRQNWARAPVDNDARED
jgi:hypothetical protein